MFVIMDLEWFETKKHHICPTQIAALRVDGDWNTVAAFNELICPHEGVSAPWGHVSFSGASSEAFIRAHSAHAVFERLEQWLKPDDVLCWWDNDSVVTLKLLLKAILKRNYTNETCILQPYFAACVNDGKLLEGNPYSLAGQRKVPTPQPRHCSMNDVCVIQRLMHAVKFPTQMLRKPVPPRRTTVRTNAAEYLFLYDETTNLLHLPGSGCAEKLKNLRGMATIKSCLAKKYKPCPECCMTVWKEELGKYNEEVVQKRRCAYFFFEDSKVFHRGTCHVIRMATRNYTGTVYYDTCIGTERVPCKICKPEPGLTAAENPPKEAKEEPSDGWMRKNERRAFERYAQAVKERSAAVKENMSAAERKDILTLTTTKFAFWAAQGYSNFHLRSCRKLNGLTALKGFETYQHAIRAGYQPCRECKPSKKYNMEISIPINTIERKEETLEEVLAICSRWGLEHDYRESILSIRTSAAEWEMDTTVLPVVIYHKPAGSNLFHEQHKMFMSLSDAVAYVAKHDNVKKQSLEGMLLAARHKREE